MSETNDILSLKRQALQAKKAGDLERAKNFLRQAKVLEQQQQQQQQQQPAKQPAQAAQVDKDKEVDHEPKDDDEQRTPITTTTHQEDPVNKAMDEATLDELDPTADATNNHSPLSVTEMLDTEALQDLRECGMEIPSEIDYQGQILQCKQEALQYKKAGDIPKAKQALGMAKQLEKASQVLYSSSVQQQQQSSSSSPQELDLQELTTDEQGLLAELQMYNDQGRHASERDDENNDDDDAVDLEQELFGHATTTSTTAQSMATNHMQLDLDDLEDMDIDMIRDMMQTMGMTLPNVCQVQEQVETKKAQALAYKKQGDLQAAKMALAESKKLQLQAQKLANVLQAMQQDDGTDSDMPTLDAAIVTDDALEQLVAASETTETKPMAAQTPATSPNANNQPAALQSSAQYKAQALQYKQQGDKEKALAALRLYKQALMAESQAKVAAQRLEILQQLQAEIAVAQQQARMFQFYQYFADTTEPKWGATMAAGWRRYARDCTAYATALQQQQGQQQIETMAPLQRSSTAALQRLNDDKLSFVGSTCATTETRLEFALIALLDMHTNKYLSTINSNNNNPQSTKQQADNSNNNNNPTPETMLPPAEHIKVKLTAHLPVHVDNPDQDVHLEFQPSRLLTEGGKNDSMYLFETSQFVPAAERDHSRWAKTWARRLTRKRCVTLEVWYVRPKVISKGGLFGRKMSEMEETLLGSAVLELSDLLHTNFVATDVALMESRKEVGGRLRLAVRSGKAFGETMVDDEEMEESLKPIALVGYPHFLLPR